MNFVDTAKVYLKAGDGGDGCNSFERLKSGRRGRPNGGPGGKGGDIIFEADINVHTLLDFHYRQHFKAKKGSHGGSNHKAGAQGEDCIIKVPPGTIIYDYYSKEILRDLDHPGLRVCICKGGSGGKGNTFARQATEGEEGESRVVLLELKLIADVGIIGYPNAGKSTLLSHITNAKPKIADYPFTTKEPILGVVKYRDREIVVADIPGLIDGAHRGRGLGHRFLRHIERARLLLHLLDMAGAEERDPVEDYLRLNIELKLYSSTLVNKPQIIVANKMDVGDNAVENLKRFKRHIRKKVVPISAQTGMGLKTLLGEICRRI